MLSNNVSIMLIIAYTMTIIGYLGHARDAIPKWSTFIGMVLISGAYIFMLLGKLLYKKENEDTKKATTLSKNLSISGYILASIFFFGIHIFPALTFHVRYYDIFGAIGYALSAIGALALPVMLPIGYSLCTMYYICGGYQKVGEKGWIDHIHLVARTILAVIYGMLSVKYIIK